MDKLSCQTCLSLRKLINFDKDFYICELTHKKQSKIVDYYAKSI